MAELIQTQELASWIDDYLDYLLRAWRGIPALADEWVEWDEHSRLVLELDWPIVEDRLQQLAGWAERGLLDADQRARYEALLTLVAQQRPTLERLLAE